MSKAMAATDQALDQHTREIIQAIVNRDESEVTDQANLVEDLGMDSLDVIEIVMELEEQLVGAGSIEDAEADGWKTVADVLTTVRKAAKQ